jgi:hypothetical protein
VKPADPLDGLLPPAPPGRDLPHHDRHRGDLLAIIGSEHTAGYRRPVAMRLAPLGAALAVIILVAGVFVLPGLLGGPQSGGPRPGGGPASSGPSASAGRDGQKIRLTKSSLVSSAVTGLVLRGGVGDVNITGANRSTVAITAHLSYRGSAPVITRGVSHGLLDLGYRCLSRSRDCGVAFDIMVPRALAVTVRWGTGPIRLGGLTGSVLVHAGVGPIQANGMSGPLIRLYTGAGSISVRCTAPPRLLVASSGVGEVTVRVPVTVAYRVTAKTQVGSVRVTVPQAAGSGHKIYASTGTGAVTVAGS